MAFSLFDEVTTAIDVGCSQLKLLQVKRSSGSLRLLQAWLGPTPALETGPTNAARLAEAVAGVLAAGSHRSKKLTVSVGPPRYELRRVTLPQMAPAAMGDALRWMLADQLSFPIERATIDFKVLPPAPGAAPTGSSSVFVVAVDRESLELQLDLAERLGLQASSVQVASLAVLGTFCNCPQSPKGGTVALIDLGHAGTSVTIATDGMVRLHRYVPVGGRHLTLHLAEKQQLDEAAASKLKTQLTSLDPLVEPLEQLAVRVERVFQHFEDLNPCEKIDHIRICGGTAALAGLPEFFSEFFQERVERLNPFEQLGLGPEHPSAETLRVSAWAFAACWGLVA